MAVVTPRCAAFTAAAKLRFPAASFAGIFACRTIIPHDGGSSSTWSEHAWGNAVDFGGSPATMDRIIAFAQANQSRFGINNIIPPGSAVNVVHVDFNPSHAGSVPPCAGGPHVKSPKAKTGKITTYSAKPPHDPFKGVYGKTFNASANVDCATWDLACKFGDILAIIGRWLEVGAGGSLMVVGLGVIIVGATGKAAGPVVGAAIGATGPIGAAAAGTATVASSRAPARPDLAADRETVRRAKVATATSKASQARSDAEVSRAYAKEARAAQARGRERSSIKGPSNRAPRSKAEVR